MYISPIPTYMSNHPEYATRFAAQLAALDEANAASVEAGNALRDAREAEKQATADRVAGTRNAPHADQMTAIVSAAEAKARGMAARQESATAALSKAVHSDHAFTSTSALDYFRQALPALDAAIPVLEDFFGEGFLSGNYEHAAQRVQLPATRYVFGLAAHDPGQRRQWIAALRAEIDSVRQRLAQVTEAKPPMPVFEVPMTEARLHGRTDLGAGMY